MERMFLNNTYFDHISDSLFIQRHAAGVYHHIPCFQVVVLYQYLLNVLDGCIGALKLGVMEGFNAPAQTELIDDTQSIAEDIDLGMWPEATKFEGGVSTACHSNHSLRI